MGSTSSAAFLRAGRRARVTLHPHAQNSPTQPSTPGLLPSLLGRDCLLQVPELERAVLRSGEQS